MSRAFGEHFSRRAVLVGGSAAFALARSATSVVAQSSNTPRQSVTGAGSAALASYKKAIKAMLVLPPDDPRNWYRQGLIHTIDCPHGNWWFLPWHRGYLANFEAVCREMSGDATFSLPFWDWTETPRVPASFFEDVLDPTHASFIDGAANFQTAFGPTMQNVLGAMNAAQKTQLALRGITTVNVLPRIPPRGEARGLTAANPDLDEPTKLEVAFDRIKQAIEPRTFEEFGSTHSDNHHRRGIKKVLETGPHDNVHGSIPGLMENPSRSSFDPIFWLHHCNLDRLWTVWLKKQIAIGKPVDPPDAEKWRKEPFLFFVNGKGNPIASTCGDCIDNDTLGVSYGAGTGDDLVPASAPPVIVLPDIREFGGQSVSRPLRIEREVSISAQIPSDIFVAASRGTVVGTPAPEATQAPQLQAEITIAPPSNSEGTTMKVFMNCPYLDADTPISDKHYVGRITFFGSEHHHEGGGPHLETYSLPISSVLQRLPQDRPNKSTIKIQLLADREGQRGEVLDGAVKELNIKAL